MARIISGYAQNVAREAHLAGKIKAIDNENDTADLFVLDASGNPTSEVWENIPIFYHCEKKTY